MLGHVFTVNRGLRGRLDGRFVGPVAATESFGSAHKKSIAYAQEKMRDVYGELGIPMPGAEGPGGNPLR